MEWDGGMEWNGIGGMGWNGMEILIWDKNTADVGLHAGSATHTDWDQSDWKQILVRTRRENRQKKKDGTKCYQIKGKLWEPIRWPHFQPLVMCEPNMETVNLGGRVRTQLPFKCFNANHGHGKFVNWFRNLILKLILQWNFVFVILAIPLVWWFPTSQVALLWHKLTRKFLTFL